MADFIGEIECKLDGKGRVLFPSAFQKQLSEGDSGRMYIKLGFENCLYMYTYQGFSKIKDKLKSLNTFNPQKREFIRLFMQGIAEVTIDSSNRVLIPKRLIESVGLKKELVMLGCFNRIEVWDRVDYTEAVKKKSAAMVGELANSIFGDEMADFF